MARDGSASSQPFMSWVVSVRAAAEQDDLAPPTHELPITVGTIM